MHCILSIIVDTANELESELYAHCDAVLEEDDLLGNRIQSFVDHTNATIVGLREKYDQLRIDNELLKKLHSSHDTRGVAAVGDCRMETSITTGKPHTETVGMYSRDATIIDLIETNMRCICLFS